MKLLEGRAEGVGEDEVAHAIRAEWKQLAEAMKIHEDYHGFYTHEAEDVLQRKIDDMLTEAEPRAYKPDEVAATEWESGQTPVRMCSVAWRNWENAPAAYPDWERRAIEQLLNTPLD